MSHHVQTPVSDNLVFSFSGCIQKRNYPWWSSGVGVGNLQTDLSWWVMGPLFSLCVAGLRYSPLPCWDWERNVRQTFVVGKFRKGRNDKIKQGRIHTARRDRGRETCIKKKKRERVKDKYVYEEKASVCVHCGPKTYLDT